MTRTDDGSRSTDPYLVFAHEPYYPGPNTREINTSLLDVLLRRPRTHREAEHQDQHAVGVRAVGAPAVPQSE